MDGVTEANVNFTLEKATISYDPELVSLLALEEKIASLGFETVKETAELELSGMTCAACANRIEKGLNKVPGVSKATVNFALETARIEYQPDEANVQDFINKVEQLGYQAKVKDEGIQEDQRQKEIQKQQRKFLFSVILSFPLLWAMVSHFTFTSWIWLPELFMNPWFQLALATPVQFIIGGHFYVGAYKALRNKSANMDVLVALGTSVAYFYSIYLTVQSIGHSTHQMELYYETSAILITLIILGKLF
jgi:Cu+-exporting ATPase